MRESKWSRDVILRTLRSMYNQGKDLSYNSMARVNQALVSACNYHYGSYRRAILMAGLDYAEIIRKPRWTRDRVARLLKRAHRAGEDLSWRVISNRRDDLGRAAIAAVRPRLFGSWTVALRAAGLNPDQIQRYHRWDPENVVAELQSRHEAGLAVNSGVIQQEIPGLYGFATHHFGNYDKALQAAGIDPSTVRQRRQWTRQQVLREMQAFQRRHGSLAHTLLRQLDSGLQRAIMCFFKSMPVARAALERHTGVPVLGGRKGRPVQASRRPTPGKQAARKVKRVNGGPRRGQRAGARAR